MKITAIETEPLRLPLDPPFAAAWDESRRPHADATLVRVRTDEGITGYGSGCPMTGFADWQRCRGGARAGDLCASVIREDSVRMRPKTSVIMAG
jgi:L-alanine-DL-glutamate epimerase-like enolase superfamily enzyme